MNYLRNITLQMDKLNADESQADDNNARDGLLANKEKRDGSGGSGKSADLNAYQNKKVMAQGMMDLALLSANTNQLRHVLEIEKKDPYYFTSLVLISLSIIFQIGVGVGLIWNYRNSMKNEEEISLANKINKYTVIGIFIVTVVNVLIPSFGV